MPDFCNIATSGESQAHLCAGEFPLLWYLWDAVGHIGSMYRLASLRKLKISVWVYGINYTAN